MQSRLIVFLATAILSLSATSAHAFAVYSSESGETLGPFMGSDQVAINVFLLADMTGIERISVAVLFDPTVLAYNSGATSVPSTILDSGSSVLIPSQDPPLLWPAPPPGQNQVNLNWELEDIFGPGTQVTAAEVQMATVVFDVVQGGTETEVSFSLSVGGTIFQVDNVDIKNSVQVSSPVSIAAAPVPVPALSPQGTLLLIGLLMTAACSTGRASTKPSP